MNINASITGTDTSTPVRYWYTGTRLVVYESGCNHFTTNTLTARKWPLDDELDLLIIDCKK
uniref:Uncharacterized protein n=1 Tax=Glossina pallidipes TaxID=7398 RepID=A0A1A9ZRR2_GLOPL